MTITTAAAKKVIEQYPDTPSLTLAKKLMSDYPELFRNVESARSTIRRLRGANGNERRKYCIAPREFSKKLFNPFGLPPSDPLPYPFVHLSGSRMLVLSDVHFPYHDVEALTVAIQAGKDFNADHILINGDALDFYQLSRFEKDPRLRSFSEELQIAKEFFAVLRREFPGAQITYKIGNHEERYDSFMRVKAPELLDVPGLALESLMGLGDDVRIVKDKLRIKFGKLPIIHGHEYPTPVLGPVNAARGLFLRTKTSALCGHHHQVSEHTEADLNDKIITTWSTGCLCQLHPHYARLNKWSHGFAMIEKDDAGNFTVQNRRINNGKLL